MYSEELAQAMSWHTATGHYLAVTGEYEDTAQREVTKYHFTGVVVLASHPLSQRLVQDSRNWEFLDARDVEKDAPGTTCFTASSISPHS